MTHIDEGTIHAWLDGALGEAQAREVEAHAQQCAECAAAVAEARGLIAGSSRILSALDDVPANLIPIGSKRAPAGTVAKRRWRAAPWVTSIAAVLVFAVVMRTSREASREMTAAMPVAQPAKAEARSGDTATPPLAATPAPAPTPATATSGAGQSAPIAPVRRQRSGFAAGAAGADVSADFSSARDQAMPASVASQKAHPQAAEPRAAPTVVPGDLAGCYSIPTALPPARTLSQAPPPVRAREDRRAAAAIGMAEMAQPATPRYALVELARAVSDSGFVAREARSDSIVGTWFPIAPDAADVMLKNGLRVRVSRSGRSSCPTK